MRPVNRPAFARPGPTKADEMAFVAGSPYATSKTQAGYRTLGTHPGSLINPNATAPAIQSTKLAACSGRDESVPVVRSPCRTGHSPSIHERVRT
jgi:hypothetical protein